MATFAELKSQKPRSTHASQHPAVAQEREIAERWAKELTEENLTHLGLPLYSLEHLRGSYLEEEDIHELFNNLEDLAKLELIKDLSREGGILSDASDIRQQIEDHLGERLGVSAERRFVYMASGGIFEKLPGQSTEALDQIRQVVDHYKDALRKIYYKTFVRLVNVCSALIEQQPDGTKDSPEALLKKEYRGYISAARKHLAELKDVTSEPVANSIAKTLKSMSTFSRDKFEDEDRKKMVLGDYVLDLVAYQGTEKTFEDCLESRYATNHYQNRPVRATRKVNLNLVDRCKHFVNPAIEKEYRASKGLSALKEPLVKNEVWERFLMEAVPDEGMRESMLQALAIGVFGAPTSFRNFLDLHGAPRSGKSSILIIMGYLFKDFVRMPSNSAFAAKAGLDNRMKALADAEGARLVALEEFQDIASSSTIKMFSGGNEFTTRRLYENTITWLPQGTLVFVSNPGLQFDADADEAFIKRWLPVHFPYSKDRVEGKGDGDTVGLYEGCKANLGGIFLSLARAYERAKASGAQVEPGVFELKPSTSQEAYKASKLYEDDPIAEYLAAIKERKAIIPVEEGDDTSTKSTGNILVKVATLQKGFDKFADTYGFEKNKTVRAYLKEHNLSKRAGSRAWLAGYKENPDLLHRAGLDTWSL